MPDKVVVGHLDTGQDRDALALGRKEAGLGIDLLVVGTSAGGQVHRAPA